MVSSETKSVIARAKQIYAKSLQAALESEHRDRFVAIEPESGKLRWYYQFTPHDLHDWDATETPVLVDTNFRPAACFIAQTGSRSSMPMNSSCWLRCSPRSMRSLKCMGR